LFRNLFFLSRLPIRGGFSRGVTGLGQSSWAAIAMTPARVWLVKFSAHGSRAQRVKRERAMGRRCPRWHGPAGPPPLRSTWPRTLSRSRGPGLLSKHSLSLFYIKYQTLHWSFVSGYFSDLSQRPAGVPIRAHRVRKVRSAALCELWLGTLCSLWQKILFEKVQDPRKFWCYGLLGSV
jgi:hypothetical protein